MDRGSVAITGILDTRCRTNAVPVILEDILTKSDFTHTLCARIMTSIAENLVKCNRYIAKPAFDATQELSQEVKGTRIAESYLVGLLCCWQSG